MSGTSSPTVRVRPDSSAWAAGFGWYPRLSATARTCSRVRWLTRPGRVNDRDTVDGATPAAAATSVIVAGPGRALRMPRWLGHGTSVANLGKRLPL